ncbi:hypothetical protein BD311DRAFT_799393 [Dichomitus squalens]|uniref:Uncharacterized protein n=1 Tax=Dichomitus squalens TaxID=114155 RepID=A0A4Q9Q2U8_9APHY|nr:hypothetical protein BD311DRAFT_799393 [Dichomitus squalens]TBU61577.1 hypothetical protein BD310DRAFT_904577 [Dichomitus squalens]
MPVTPSAVVDAMTASQSREAALHGHRALTPILSGIISGGIVGVAWIIGIIVWAFKRIRRARRAKAAGFRSYREFLDPPKLKDPFIIPPDPAVLQGQVQPGQKVVIEKEKGGKDKARVLKHANTVPIVRVEDFSDEQSGREANGYGGGSPSTLSCGAKAGVPPGMEHNASAPASIPSPNIVKARKSAGNLSLKRDTYPPLSRSSTDSQRPMVKAPEDHQ